MTWAFKFTSFTALLGRCYCTHLDLKIKFFLRQLKETSNVMLYCCFSDLSAERCVRVDDVKKAISTTDNFYFLTNKYLGKKSS